MNNAFSLAGAPIDYIVAGEVFLDALSSSYVFLARSSLYAAREALNNSGCVGRNVRRVIEERERVWRVLNASGVRVYPSSTDFLLVKTEISDIVRRFRDIGVLIADLTNQLPPGFVRVSIGTREENDALITGYMKIREVCE